MEISLKEKKEIMLEMLVEIDSFCKEREIKYFLVGGTLIGAIRHGGYIPWDDDVDIALLRDDYEKLLECYKSKSGNVELWDFRNCPNYVWPSAKFIHNKTILIENNIRKAPIGINIDVFPLDNVPGGYDEVVHYTNKVQFWRKLLSLKYMRINRSRGLIKNCIVLLSKSLYLIPDKTIIGRFHSLSIRYRDRRDCVYLCSFAGAWGKREITKKEYFLSSINHVFEGHLFPIPCGYDGFLQNIYGDYMTPPPMEKRISTHNSIEYWK